MNRVDEIMETDFRYCVDYDYDRTRCVCPPDSYDYCRCTRIINEVINSVEIKDVSREINDVLSGDLLTHYCIDRILTATKMYEPNNWEINICGGYYGEEIDSVLIDNDKLKEWLIKFVKLGTDVDKIKLALECEYGYVLDKLIELNNLDIKTIPVKDIIVPQKEHYTKLELDIVDKYKEYDLPRCLVVKEGNDKYRLIDGYHRMSASNEDNVLAIAMY